MSYPGNFNSFINTANARSADLKLTVFGPSAATALGGGIFSSTDGTSGDLYFTIVGLSSETVQVTRSMDGTNYSAALLPIDLSTGMPVAADTLAAGRYVLPLKVFGSTHYVKFVKSSTSEIIAVAVAEPYGNPNHVGV